MANMSVFIIAEIGVNHDGDLDKAKRLIDAAKAAGADAAKFQYFSSHKLWRDERIKHLELRFSEFVILHNYCQRAGIEFMATPFGVEEVILLRQLVKRWKIASGCITRMPILDAVRDTQLPVILSTGMATMKEIAQAEQVLWDGDLTLLHCTSAYPCPINEVNLLAMLELRDTFRTRVGYSDHTKGITVAIAAAAMGAEVIEKHLTLDCAAEGPDHAASIEPDEFRVMVSAIRTVEEALGDVVKRVQECDEQLRKARREPPTSDRPS
jgi:N,N'-diacetyllegionaminate synthase